MLRRANHKTQYYYHMREFLAYLGVVQACVGQSEIQCHASWRIRERASKHRCFIDAAIRLQSTCETAEREK